MKSPSAVIRIALTAEHDIYRFGLGTVIKEQPQFELVAEAEDLETLFQAVYRHKPDVVITDVKTPTAASLRTIQKMKEELPHIAVIALTGCDEESLIIDILEAGAKGHLSKKAHRNEIVKAIETVSKDNLYYCNRTNAKLAHLLTHGAYATGANNKKAAFIDRELQIIQLVCEQYTNQEIAGKLFLSKRTIETYREHILEKTGAKNTAGIVLYAIRNGLFTM